MTYDPNTDPQVLALRKKAAQATIDAQAKADRFMKDDNLARLKGHTPEQIEARKRVAALFCELHMPRESADAIKHRLDGIDYMQTVTTTNGRGKELEHPKGTGLLGLGHKPAYLVSLQFPPSTPEAPIYALEYFPVKH